MVILLYLYFHPLDLTSISLTARLTLSGGILECVLFFTFSTVKEIAFFFFLTLPFFPYYFPFLSTLFSHLFPLFFFSLSPSLSLYPPSTYRCSLSFVSFSPCENHPPTITLLFYIIIYYYCLLLFYIKKY